MGQWLDILYNKLFIHLMSLLLEKKKNGVF